MNLTSALRQLLADGQADLVGFADLSQLPPEARQGLPRAVAVAVRYPKDVIRGIAELPTQQYFDDYTKLNSRLDQLVTEASRYLRESGYQAIPQTLGYVRSFGMEYGSPLPHKTVATRAGLGWIGKCALLVTKQFGSMLRLSSLLTDAPLAAAQPVDESSCGSCTDCVDACPGKAVVGNNWYAGLSRESLLDAQACSRTARERALRGFGQAESVCGRCIEVCPFTRRYLQSTDD